MATIAAVITPLNVESLGRGYGGQSVKVVWANMANGDVGEAVDLHENADRSVQVADTNSFAGSANLRFEGSNDGSTYLVLSDPQGTALNLTSATIKAVTEPTSKVRPHVTAGNGSTSITVTLFARR